MIFWDSSALVALLVDEADSETRLQQLQTDPELAVWWGTPVECESAIQRRFREGSLAAPQARLARERLADLSNSWHEVSPVVVIRTLSRRLLRTHPLRAADALQLAAALALGEAASNEFNFACSDVRLATAAEIEGLQVI
ncbi:type II toxin-antitoxin system VapC family toxin [Haloferula sp.]|uniref:type II toxin-antitoxin system VapC family toxin n=1 Tax=Haloferula sp. TaxID=2497595 RepID=UPI003C752FD3